MIRMKIRAGRLRESLHDLNENGEVGDWCFEDNRGRLYMFLAYPNGYYPESWEVVSLPLSGDQHPVWQWDGNREAPTLTPSINVVGRWHGFLRNGKLETC